MTEQNSYQTKYKARQPRQQRGRHTKERIMNAAEELFITHGYHGTDSKQIARHAGVSTGSFYSYFHDKKDVFIVVVWDRVQRTTAAMKEYINSRDRSNNTREIMSGLIDLTMEHLSPELFREVTILKYHDADVRNLQERTTEMASELLSPLIKSMDNRLRVTDLEAGIEMIIITVMEVVHTATIFSQRIPRERIINELIDMVNEYLWKNS
jgi:AcrR family transcriptional regulator